MDNEHREPDRRVVVGVDGSPSSRRALRFAADEARLRSADLTVVTSFTVPDMLWPAQPQGSTLDNRMQTVSN